MKCTNKIMGVMLVLTLSFICGCGQATVAFQQPYDIYETTKTAGISTVAQTPGKSYFSSNLCVSEDVSIGTDTTTSQVAEGAGTFNLATNSVVYSKNIYKKLYPASTTKILTAYVTLKYCSDLEAVVTVSENTANQAEDSSKCDLKAGDQIKVKDLLYGLMLRSGNDAAIAIAEYISGDVDSFVSVMNQEAALLGATQSHFANPHGLPNENHYTSVYDMYLLFAKALENPAFVELIRTTSHDAVYMNASGETVEKTWENTNHYLTGNTKAPEGFTVVGGKTGTTKDAGYCLVLYSYNPANQPIISIVFKAGGRSDLYLLMNEMLNGFGR